MILELNNIKRYLNIDDDYKDDDQLIIELEAVAEEAIARYVNRDDLDEFNLESGDHKHEAPKGLKMAALMLIAELYNNREMNATVQLHTNPAFDILLAPNYKYSFPA